MVLKEKEEVMTFSLLFSIAEESIFLLEASRGSKKPHCPTDQICL